MFTLAHPQHNLVANWFLLCQSCQQNNIFLTKGIFIILKFHGDNSWQILMWYLACKEIFDLPSPKKWLLDPAFFSPKWGLSKLQFVRQLSHFFHTPPTPKYESNRPNILQPPKEEFPPKNIPFLIFCNLSKSFSSLGPTFPNLKGTKEPLYGYSCWLNQLFIFYDLMPFANALKCIFLRKKREFSRLLLWYETCTSLLNSLI